MRYFLSVLLWTLVLILLAGVIAWWVYGEDGTSEKEQSTHKVTFICASGDSIQAAFRNKSVDLKLPDRPHLMLQRGVSGSGARYINDDSTLVFWNKGNTSFIREGDAITYKKCVQKGQDDLVNLKSYKAQDLQFRYPEVLQVSKETVTDTTGWSYESTEKGDLIAQFRFDTTAQSKTNLSEATFTVGRSETSQAYQKCMEAPRGRSMNTDSLQRSGITYMYSPYADAGAGNFYQVKRYRTQHAGSCYSVEEMVHTTNIHNYPPDRGITAYDSARVWKALDVAWQTFRFKR